MSDYHRARPAFEDSLLSQYVEAYEDNIQNTFANTRIGDLLVNEHAITLSELREALQAQKNQQGLLGKILLKMGRADKKAIDRTLNVQKTRRLESINILLKEKLRLGQILLSNHTITNKELKEALERQKRTSKPLGQTLVEMKVISRGTLETYLRIQENVRKFVVTSGLALILLGSATGMSGAQTSYTNMTDKQKSFTKTDSIERKDYSKKRDKKGYDYQGKPAAVTPFEFKYKRIRDYLRIAYRFEYKLEKKGRDHWQLPEETERLGAGDCEDKAIWLYSKALKDGFDDVRLVIGKEKEDSRIFHTWVAWYPQGKVYILDPTNDSEMWEIEKYPKGYYKPYYSFYRDKSWRHS